MAVSRFIGGTATWISGGRTSRETGNYGCTWITRTFPIRSNRERYHRLTIRLPVPTNLAIQPLVKPRRSLKQPSVGDQSHDIPHPVKHSGTMRAYFEMRFHPLA